MERQHCAIPSPCIAFSFEGKINLISKQGADRGNLFVKMAATTGPCQLFYTYFPLSFEGNSTHFQLSLDWIQRWSSQKKAFETWQKVITRILPFFQIIQRKPLEWWEIYLLHIMMHLMVHGAMNHLAALSTMEENQTKKALKNHTKGTLKALRNHSPKDLLFSRSYPLMLLIIKLYTGTYRVPPNFYHFGECKQISRGHQKCRGA